MLKKRIDWRSAWARWIVLGASWIMLIAFGCQSTEPSPAQKNIDTFQLAEQKITTLRDNVVQTLDALHQYREHPAGHTFDEFVRHVNATEAAGSMLPDIFSVMNDQGGAYFSQWDSDIAAMTDPGLKANTTRQKMAAKAAFDQVDAGRPRLSAAYEKFVADLRNLRTYFGYNKSVAGIKEASHLIDSTRIDGADLLRQLNSQTANVSNIHKTFITISRG